MKVIQPSRMEKKLHRIVCINELCGAIVECETFELQHFKNSHGGDYFLMHCPCCGVSTAIDGPVIRGED